MASALSSESRQALQLRALADPFSLLASSLLPSPYPPRPFRARRYFQHDHALSSLRYISGTKLDERIIRADLDPGYLENRQYGRGKSGGQVR